MRNFDELNIISYKDYFDVMSLSDKQKRERIRAAEELEDIILYYLISIDLSRTIPIDPKDRFIEDYSEVVRKYIDDDDFISMYVPMLAVLLAESTLKHINEEYYLSVDRAMSIAANEANTILNQSDYDKATIAGYTRKQWITEHDNKVRPTHIEVEDLIIPINELFVVGSAVMRYPHDFVMAADHSEEISNCRCSIAYLR